MQASLHHHRLLAAVREGEHKPSVVVDGDALNGGAESAVLPFGVEEVKLAELKEETAELVRFELLICSLPCESRITLLRGCVPEQILFKGRVIEIDNCAFFDTG